MARRGPAARQQVDPRASGSGPAGPQAVDPDIDRHVARDRDELRRAPVAVLGVISLGGGLGGLARYGLGMWWPTGLGEFPWTIFVINVSGSALIGILMVLVSEVWPDRRLLRPFLGVGVLGGYTTFSIHVVEAQQLIERSETGLAVLYLAATAVTAVAAVAVAVTVTRWWVRRRARVPVGRRERR